LIDKIKITKARKGSGNLMYAKLESGAYENPYGWRIKIRIILIIRLEFDEGKVVGLIKV
jgi:hypothetical protein